MKIDIDLNEYPYTTYSDILPENLNEYQLPSAETTFIQGAFGKIIGQRVVGDMYEIMRFTYLIDRPVHVYISTEVNISILHFMSRGTVHGEYVHTPEIVSVPEGKFHLYFLPADIKGNFFFEPGIYISSGVKLLPQYMEIISSKHLLINEIWDSTKGTSTEVRQQLSGTMTPTIIKNLDLIYNCDLPAHKRDLFIQARINDIILLYIDEMDSFLTDDSVMNNYYKARIEKLIEYINTHLDEDLIVSSIAEQMKLSISTLERIFKIHQGVTLISFIQITRIKRAEKLLKETNVAISDIANIVGYSDPAYFSAVFKKHYNESPSTYRKKYNY